MRSETDEMTLTAYALGELDEPDRREVEARLAASAQDRQFVEEVRVEARLIAAELSREPVAGLDAIHYAAVEMRLGRTRQGAPAPNRRAILRGRIGFGLTVAASVTIVCAVIGAVLTMVSHRDERVAVAPARPTLLIIPREAIHHDAVAGVPRPRGGAGPFVNVADQAVSRFPLNSDEASYEALRDALRHGRLPDPDSVRIDGLVNAFAYDYPTPAGDAAFAAQIEIGQCPWRPDHRLARIAIKARSATGDAASNVICESAFDPKVVRAYRLIGYDDASSGGQAAGENVCGGHQTTALYEIAPVQSVKAGMVLLTLRLRYSAPGSTVPRMMQFAGVDRGDAATSPDFSFAAAVAELGMLLRNSPQRGAAAIDAVIQLAQTGQGADALGQRRQFIEIARQIKAKLG